MGIGGVRFRSRGICAEALESVGEVREGDPERLGRRRSTAQGFRKYCADWLSHYRLDAYLLCEGRTIALGRVAGTFFPYGTPHSELHTKPDDAGPVSRMRALEANDAGRRGVRTLGLDLACRTSVSSWPCSTLSQGPPSRGRSVRATPGNPYPVSWWKRSIVVERPGPTLPDT